MNEREIFLNAAIAVGCPEDQTRNFVAAKLWLQERQLVASAAARSCDLPDGPTTIGYGGARGGGKSHWMLSQVGADDCQRVPGLKCLLLRKVGKANFEHFEDLRQRLFNRLPHEFSAFRGILTFANGSRIIAGHFQNDRDVDAYLGLEYDVIGIEEATTLTSRKFQDITTCCRTSKPNWRPRIHSTTNPGGVGHAWYRTRFVLPMLERRQTDTVFVAARVTDNRWNNPEYIRVLQGLSGWQRRAWLDGDWDIAAGQFFTQFRRDVHVVEDFDDARAVEWFCAFDYGHVHYTVCLLGCRDGDGNTYVVDEHAERLWLPQRHAAAIKAMLARHKVDDRSLTLAVYRDPMERPDERHRELFDFPDADKVALRQLSRRMSAEGRFNTCCAPDAQRRALGEFGNLNDRSLGEIWDSREYQHLVHTYHSRPLCQQCTLRQPV